MPKIKCCRVCGGDLKEVLDLGNMAFTGRFPKLGEAVPYGQLALVLCIGECGLVQLADSFSLAEMYGPTYGYRSGLNHSMAKHLQQLTALFVRNAPLGAGDTIIDIGASDGTLLKAIPREVTRIGIDPSAEKFKPFYPKDIRLIVDFFQSQSCQKELAATKAKVITSIAMFYDLEDPIGFAKTIASLLTDNGIWHTEQSYLPAMLGQNAFDTICHEHLEYYSLKQIKYIAKKAKLKVIGMYINQINGGSFGVTLAHQKSPYEESSEFKRLLAIEKGFGLQDQSTYSRFRESIDQQGDLLHKTLDELESPWGFGASTKGNVLLQYYGISKQLGGVYDINPDKDSCITPGTHIPITMHRPPGVTNYLVLPWHFRGNILEQERRYLENGCKFVFPLPKVEVVSGE